MSKDLVLAYFWYSLALDSGGTSAANRQVDLKQTMTRDQITEAEQLVAEWRPNPAECEVIRVQAEN